jgi:putative phosphoesterase
MRIAVISDIHGNLVALEAVLADIRQRSPDLTLNLGDVATGPLWPRQSYERVMEQSIASIRGNHDRWLSEGTHDSSPSVRYTREQLGADTVATLAELPPTDIIDGDVLAVHGTPRSDTDFLIEEKMGGVLVPRRTEALRAMLAGITASLVLCGHSHRQGVASAGDALIVNPGAVGGPRFADNPDPLAAEAGTRHACYAFATRARNTWRVELVALPYDWAPVLRRARDNGRADWAGSFGR